MFRKIKSPTYEGETNTGEKVEEWILGVSEYFQVHNYSSEMKSCLAIYNLNNKASRWWRDLKHTKKDDLREVWWTKFHNIFQEKYMSKSFFEKKLKEFHELRMGSMTMDSLLTDLLICCIMYHTAWIRK